MILKSFASVGIAGGGCENRRRPKSHWKHRPMKRERLKLENALLDVLNGVLDEVLDECEDPSRI